jgi:transcriptional regulator with XRE-family HTH domain
VPEKQSLGGADKMISEEQIAINIKKLRKRSKQTLKDLSELTGLTISYLSKIERSKKVPPYSTLSKIAVGLGVDPTLLLNENMETSKNKMISFTKKNQRKAIKTLKRVTNGFPYKYSYEALAFDKPGKNMEPFVLEPAFDEKAFFEHEGEELIFVLEGEHEFTYGGEKFIMSEGDSVYFDSSVPHSGKSLGTKKAKVLLVMYNYKRL